MKMKQGDVYVCALDHFYYDLRYKTYHNTGTVVGLDVHNVGVIPAALVYEKLYDNLSDNQKFHIELNLLDSNLLNAKIKYVVCSVVSLESQPDNPIHNDEKYLDVIGRFYEQYCETYPDLVVKFTPLPGKFNFKNHKFFWE